MIDSGAALKGKRVLFVFPGLDLGGSEKRGLFLADFLRRRLGASVRVLGLGDKQGRVCGLCDELEIPWRGVPFHWGARRRFTSLARAIAAIRSERAEIVLSYTRVPNLVCAWGRRLTGARLSVWNQGDEGLLLDGSLPYRLAVRAPDCFISNSTGGRDFLLGTYGLPPERVHLVRNGVALPVPVASREEWRARWHAAPGALVVGMVANLSLYKDHETLLKAWGAVLAGRWQTPPLLVLAGRGDGTEACLMRLADELGIAGQVRFPGAVDDVAGMLGALDLFAYSSKSEGVPNGVLEAMASGLAVVGTDIAGIREAVGPEGAPYLCRVGDANAMAELLTGLLHEETARRELGRAMKRRVERDFTLEAMCTKSAEVLVRELASRGGP